MKMEAEQRSEERGIRFYSRWIAIAVVVAGTLFLVIRDVMHQNEQEKKRKEEEVPTEQPEPQPTPEPTTVDTVTEVRKTNISIKAMFVIVLALLALAIVAKTLSVTGTFVMGQFLRVITNPGFIVAAMAVCLTVGTLLLQEKLWKLPVAALSLFEQLVLSLSYGIVFLSIGFVYFRASGNPFQAFLIFVLIVLVFIMNFLASGGVLYFKGYVVPVAATAILITFALLRGPSLTLILTAISMGCVLLMAWTTFGNTSKRWFGLMTEQRPVLNLIGATICNECKYPEETPSGCDSCNVFESYRSKGDVKEYMDTLCALGQNRTDEAQKKLTELRRSISKRIHPDSNGTACKDFCGKQLAFFNNLDCSCFESRLLQCKENDTAGAGALPDPNDETFCENCRKFCKLSFEERILDKEKEKKCNCQSLGPACRSERDLKLSMNAFTLNTWAIAWLIGSGVVVALLLFLVFGFLA